MEVVVVVEEGGEGEDEVGEEGGEEEGEVRMGGEGVTVMAAGMTIACRTTRLVRCVNAPPPVPVVGVVPPTASRSPLATTASTS